MNLSLPLASGVLVGVLALSGCTASAPVTTLVPGTPAPTASPGQAPTPAATPSVAGTVDGLSVDIEAPPVITTSVEGVVFAVDGVLLVNKQHPLARTYVPAWASRPSGLHPDVAASLDRLIADAKADGTKIVLRSGYRSYADQGAIFARELKNYPEATARQFFAEPGKSEHQTGLAVDVTDGINRGYAFARTEQARWLARNAWRYGFIIRYPEGRTDVTGYAWESWHLRYVGTAISTRFGPDSRLTLEEFLGVTP